MGQGSTIEGSIIEGSDSPWGLSAGDSALSAQRSALHSRPELGVLVRKQMQAADRSPFTDMDEIPDVSSIIEVNR